jgi:hypothetical protein
MSTKNHQAGRYSVVGSREFQSGMVFELAGCCEGEREPLGTPHFPRVGGAVRREVEFVQFLDICTRGENNFYPGRVVCVERVAYTRNGMHPKSGAVFRAKY